MYHEGTNMHPLGTKEKVPPQWQLLYLFFWEWYWKKHVRVNKLQQQM